MSTILKILVWIKSYVYIPLFALVSILAWVLFSRRGSPLASTALELEAIRAGLEAKRLEAERGTYEAFLAVRETHRKALAGLDEEQRKKADALINAPEKLARFLVRAGSTRR